MDIMMSSRDITVRDSNGIETPAKNTYPYSYSSLRDRSTIVCDEFQVCVCVCMIYCACVMVWQMYFKIILKLKQVLIAMI